VNPRRQLAVDQHRDVAAATTPAEIPRHHHLAGILQRLLIGQQPLGRYRFDVLGVGLPGGAGGERQQRGQDENQAHGNFLGT